MDLQEGIKCCQSGRMVLWHTLLAGLFLLGFAGCSGKFDAAHLLAEGQYAEAAKEYETLRRVDPASLRIPVWAGYANYKAGDFESCRSLLRNAQEQWQTREYAIFWIGLSYVVEGKSAEAIKEWRLFSSVRTDVRKVVHESLKALEFGTMQPGVKAAGVIERDVAIGYAKWGFYHDDVHGSLSPERTLPDSALVSLQPKPYLP